jgi:starch phosphorylase
LTALLTEVAGDRILDDPAALGKVATVAVIPPFQERYAAHRRANKVTLAKLVRQRLATCLPIA